MEACSLIYHLLSARLGELSSGLAVMIRQVYHSSLGNHQATFARGMILCLSQILEFARITQETEKPSGCCDVLSMFVLSK